MLLTFYAVFLTDVRGRKREEHAKIDWAGCEGPGARCGRWPLGGGRGDLAVPDFEKAISANEEGESVCRGKCCRRNP